MTPIVKAPAPGEQNKDRFWRSGSALYRIEQNGAIDYSKPLRPAYLGGGRSIENTIQLKAALRDGMLSWAFGESVYYICNDGGAICEHCARKNFRLICDSVSKQINDGWRVVGSALTNADDTIEGLYCDHCGEEIAEKYESEGE